MTSAGTWLRSTYPAVVGIARRLIDPESMTTASLDVAEELAVGAFGSVRAPGSPHDVERATSEVFRVIVDRSADRLHGHPGTVPLLYELDEGDDGVGFEGRLGLAELHDALVDAARWDRRVGLLAFAAGLPPVDVAALLDIDEEDVAERLSRVAWRLLDARRIGRTA